ncbi:MAG: hypothetical protein JSU82_15840 [Rhodospirillales bacterium]|nr:MAG: hypothetical protein JSU82_15840 [Rhodospirillales bacterium]
MIGRIASGFLVVLIAGCTDDDAGAPCPVARVMGEPSELTRFGEGPGRDPTDILFEAKFLQVVGECSYDDEGGEIDVELNVVIDILRGRANRDGTVSFRYFVAVTEHGQGTGSDPVIHGRQAFPVELSFADTRRNLRFTDELDITIPRPDARSVRAYVLYLGFELTAEELDYNEQKLGF